MLAAIYMTIGRREDSHTFRGAQCGELPINRSARMDEKN